MLFCREGYESGASHIKIEVHIFFITDFDVHLIISRSGLLIGQSKDLHCVTLRSEREYESGCMSKFSKFTSGTIAGIGTAKQLITAA